MAKTTIQWTDYTFNPWWGCVRVSPGCEHCYAETLANRYGHAVWGPSKTTGRRTFGDAHWRGPIGWDAAAAKAGVRRRVFCASMADVFEDHPALPPERERLWDLIERTPNLDWQLLTKRPENIGPMTPHRWRGRGHWAPANVWFGTSVEDQSRADQRVAALVRGGGFVQAKVLFLSCEPLLGPVRLDPWIHYLDWVIVGGESGPGARDFQIEWARDIRGQCRRERVAFFVKQLGRRPLTRPVEGQMARSISLQDAKGGDWDEWPEDLRVREFPNT